MKPSTTDEVGTLRSQVRHFVEQWQADGRFTSRPDNWMRGFDQEFSRGLSALGLIGLTWPREYGGRGLSNVARLAVTEELLRFGAPTGAHWVGDRQIGPSIVRHGNEKLRAEFLPAIIASDYIFCLGMSEPDAGSDLAAVKTSANKVDGGWRIRGRKVWTTGAHHATHLYLLARSHKGEHKHEGLTEFIVDLNSDGIEVSPIIDIAGEHHFNEVALDDVFVPDERVLGEIGEGWRQVIGQLAFERGGPERFLSSYPLLSELVTIKPAVTGIGHEIGELVARLATLRQLAWTVARALDGGEAPTQQAATLKLLGNAFEVDVIEVARTAYARLGRYPSGCYLDTLLASPSFSVRGGAAEVLLSMISQQQART